MTSNPVYIRAGLGSLAAAALAVALTLSPAASGDEEERELNANSHRNGPMTPPEDLDNLRRHFRAPDGAELGEKDVERIYADLKGELARRYALADVKAVAGYQSWTRFNRVPYLSASHGNRYVNHYANVAAQAYGRYEEAGRMPVGAVIAKDTFTVGEDGTVHPGALLVMEKMPAGFNYVSGDWRYVAIMPDGSILGETRGEAAEAVRFCITCHLVKEEHDHLHFVPKEYRLP